VTQHVGALGVEPGVGHRRRDAPEERHGLARHRAEARPVGARPLPRQRAGDEVAGRVHRQRQLRVTRVLRAARHAPAAGEGVGGAGVARFERGRVDRDRWAAAGHEPVRGGAAEDHALGRGKDPLFSAPANSRCAA
jgi:hypothetical protein